MVFVDTTQMDAVGVGRLDDIDGTTGNAGHDGVEELLGDDLDASGAQTRSERACLVIDVFGDAAQAVGPVVHGVHRRRHRQQHLGGADVRGRLLAANVLLTGLQGEPVRGTSGRVDGDAHQSSGELSLQPLAHGHERGVRAAVEHRDAEPLGRADDDVRAERAG